MMKAKSTKRISLTLAFLMILGLLVPATALGANDIEGHWAEDAISQWMEEDLAGGYGDGSFRPNSSITRAEFMAFVNRSFGFEEEAAITFSDVPEDAWYAGVVRQAMAAGYIAGYPDGTVRPNASITRQESSVIIAKLLDLAADLDELEKFTDGDQIPAWSRAFVSAVVKAGLMVGYPDGSFGATNLITRAESLVALNNSNNYVPPVDDGEEEDGEEEEEPIFGGGDGGAVTPALPVGSVHMISTTSSSLGTNLGALNDEARITGISFVTASTSVTMTITGIESPNMNLVYARTLSSLAGPNITIPLSSLLPAGFSGESIRLGSLRDAFGTEVTIKGTLSASGYTSYATPIKITLGNKTDTTSIWENIDINTMDKTITATLTSEGSAAALSSFDITEFLDASGNVLPAEVKFGGNPADSSGWILVAEENSEDMIDAMLALTGASSLSAATISDLVGKDIFLKSPSGTIYDLIIVNADI